MMRRIDLRPALRLVRTAPLLSTVTVILLAGGITFTTAAFSIVNAVWLQPLPYPAADRLVVVSELHPRLGHATFVSPPVYAAWREAERWADMVGAFSERSFALGRPGVRAERVRGAATSPDLLRILGATPLIGRSLDLGDARPGASPAALVSERFWRQRCAADPRSVGSTIKLDGVETVVVGVLPYGFRLFNSGFDVFTPLPGALPPEDRRSLLVVARLPQGVDREQAAAGLATQMKAGTGLPLARENGWTPVLRPLDAVLWGDARPVYLLLLTATALLLALIVANVSNLLLARAEARRQEFALRLTLGAGHAGIARQLLIEGLALAGSAGALAFILCVWLRHLLVARFPETADLRVDERVFGFVLLVSVGVGLAFGLLPAWSVLRRDVAGTLRDQVGANAPRKRSGRVLAVVQLGAAAALLTCCGLLVRAGFGIRSIEPGFETAQLLTAAVSLPAPTYPEADRRAAFYRELVGRVAALPGVVSVGLASTVPLDEGVGTVRLEVEGRRSNGDDAIRASRKTIDEGYLRTIGLSVVAGEDPAGRDPGAVVVNQALVGVLWSGDGQAAIGARIRIDRGPWLRVAGIVSDARQILTMPAAPEIYLPMAGTMPAAMSLVLRTAGNPLSVAPALTAAVQALDADVPVSNVRSMDTIIDGYFPAPFAAAFGGLAVVAILLSAVGLYAVIAFQVARRTREFGIRIALGADSRRLQYHIVSEGLRLAAAGLVPGVIAGAGFGYVLSRRLAEVAPVDPLVTALVSVVLALVAAAASLLPGRRATRIPPSVALRCE
jgi:putative ABC transport system permease protein